MPEYRRMFRPGGTFFFTMVTRDRRPLLADEGNVALLRNAVRATRLERPFKINAAVILPDHAHFLWTLPQDDTGYSARIGRVKILFTQGLRQVGFPHCPPDLSTSAKKHRESGNWQRRYWEHVIRDDDDFENHLNYIHYNPVKHRYVACPHAWPHSSFEWWARKEVYDRNWLCRCAGRKIEPPNFDDIATSVGE